MTMTRAFCAAVAVLALAICGVSATRAVPKGNYCGGVAGIVKLAVTVPQNISLDFINITGQVFGVKVAACDKEPAVYYANNGSIALPAIDKPTDCLGSYLRRFGAPLPLTITYHNDTDVVSIDAGGEADFDLKHC
eukprot:m.126795 g.126795  ORF g.126795 m.126795 type:complete len:135 (-) comp16687_c0_seq3:315-719(-)